LPDLAFHSEVYCRFGGFAARRGMRRFFKLSECVGKIERRLTLARPNVLNTLPV
jgi:hypothetical protein